MKVEDVRKKVDYLWRETKKDLDKILNDTSKMLKKGEVHLKDVSERGIEKLEEMGGILKREKLYYKLGKSLSAISRSQWGKNKKINTFLDEIKHINKSLKKKGKDEDK